jgi:hypothetical protein
VALPDLHVPLGFLGVPLVTSAALLTVAVEARAAGFDADFLFWAGRSPSEEQSAIACWASPGPGGPPARPPALPGGPAALRARAPPLRVAPHRAGAGPGPVRGPGPRPWAGAGPEPVRPTRHSPGPCGPGRPEGSVVARIGMRVQQSCYCNRMAQVFDHNLTSI